MTLKISAAMLLTGVAMSAIASAAEAQTAPAPVTNKAATNKDPDEIVVTAQRREQALSDVPLSIASVSGAALATRNVASVDDLSKLVPGLSVSDSGFSTPIYTLRGVGVNEPSIGSNSSVAIYVDEIPLVYPVMTQGVALDLQRLEVLKGPQGTLYGQNSTAGAINYIANKPTNSFEAGITGTFGRFDRGTVEGFVSGPLTDTLKARVAARYETGGNWQESQSRDDGIGKIRRFTGRAIVDWQPTDRLTATFNANSWVDKSDTVVPQFVAAYPGNSFNVDRNLVVTDGNPLSCKTAGTVAALPSCPINALTGTRITNSSPAVQPVVTNPGLIAPNNSRLADWDQGQNLRRNDKFWQLSGRLAYDLSDEVTLTSLTSYAHLDRYQNSENDGTAISETLRNVQVGSIKSFQQEVRLAADFGPVHWVFGTNYGKDKTNDEVSQFLRNSSQIQNLFGGLASSGARILARQSIKNWGVFTNVDIDITPQFTLSGGIRLSQDTRKFRGCGAALDDASGLAYTALFNFFRSGSGRAPARPIQAGECFSFYFQSSPASAAAQAQDTANLPFYTLGFANRKLEQDNVPWNVNLSYKPTESSLIYARVSRGFKAGNFSSLNTVDSVAYNPVVQEKLTSYELGGRAGIGRWLRIEGAVFRYDYVDKQVRARIFVGPPFGNIGGQDTIPKSRLQGAEGSLILRPVSGLTLSGSATYIKSKVLKYTGQTVLQTNSVLRDFSGSPFNFAPKWSLNGDLNYTMPISSTFDAFVGANVAYRGKTSSAFVPPNQTAVEQAGLKVFEIPSYTSVDGQLGVQAHDGKWRAYIWGKNIFNKFYVSNIVRVTDVIVRYPGQPATFGGTVAYKF
ncbi:TonB-dependent receptor [Sphingobium sp. CR2-8]|uniref:TonB-dependent receptor n=1 Tax=Sphingobium sp. CR2-8 TaxID=1306534 RepID=UPI002DBAECCA|nr:TonB-dependent receptor [Sphingobium sp. CR2-8]MEC3909628.1 TonB-dependent receptor [Sphingobium sp. CR2-8]